MDKKAAAKKQPKKSRKPSAPTTSADAIRDADRQLVEAALRKRSKNQKLTQREEQALKRFQNRRDEEHREKLYASMPKADYVRLSGRVHRVLDDQAQRYGLPLHGKAINLGEVLARFHDLIAQMRGRFGTGEEDDSLLDGPPSDALERGRLAQAQIYEHKLEQLRGRLVDRDEVLQSLGPVFERIRLASETLQREFGEGPHQLIDDALTESVNDIEALFDRSSSTDQPEQTTRPRTDPAGKGAEGADDA